MSVIEKGLSRLVTSAITLKPKEVRTVVCLALPFAKKRLFFASLSLSLSLVCNQLSPFWPETDSDLILVSLRDQSSPGYSAPFNYTINGSVLLRLPQANSQARLG